MKKIFSDRTKYTLIFVLAILFRLVHFFQVYQTPLISPDYVPDTLPFILIAQKILEGNFFYTIPMNMNVLYSLYLVPFVFFFSESILPAVAVQLIIDAFSAVITYLIARKIFDERAGLSAGIIYAVYAPLILFAGMPVGESISIFFLLLSFYLLIKALDLKEHSLYYYLSGLAAGIASTGRPNVIVSSVLTIAVLFFYNQQDKKYYSSTLRYILGIVIVLLPFSLNNYYLEKSFSPYPAKGGLNFYIGNHPEAKGIYELIPGTSNLPYIYMHESQEVASQEAGRELSAQEADMYWYQKGMNFITGHPVDAISLLFKKTLLFMNNKELATNLDHDFCKEFSFILKYAVIPPGLLIAFAIMGIIMIPNNKNIVLLKLFLVGLVISTVIFFISDRYRIVSLPFVIILSSGYIFVLYDYLRQKEKTKMALAASATIVLIIITFLPVNIFKINTARTTSFAYYQYGIYLLNRNKIEEAVPQFQKAIQLNSLDPEPYYYLSYIYDKKKQYRTAGEYKNKADMLGFKEDKAKTLRGTGN
ncbi:MAG: hypothetical protein A4E71_00716 [Smithella sp. PtaU1.Bin162]|nr:MAG: hypothetical protein A4E71_00716 [Smithella sp. PtaU1.Bin162]